MAKPVVHPGFFKALEKFPKLNLSTLFDFLKYAFGKKITQGVHCTKITVFGIHSFNTFIFLTFF